MYDMSPLKASIAVIPAQAGAVVGAKVLAAKAIRRDAVKHPSPNSGLSEAGVAGALHVQLGGLNYYGGIASHRATMGDPIEPLTAAHIPKTASMVYMVTLLFAVAVTVLGTNGFQRFWGM